MSDTLSAQHSPALRVGGRRLSISARPKPHNVPGASAPANTHPAENADYPRPATQGEGEEQEQEQEQAQTQTHPPPYNEEEAPKKEKKHGHGGRDQNRLKESVYRKIDATTPSKDHLGSKNSFGAGGRIGQPMGKVLAV
ncbi:hypothetical protein J3R82DRAFT_146 [Butyriboletus roseoflavus]|nr:hypothetical protein J3R82DRAFT_146 [Butyriboletus roseoflavus]